MNDAPRILVVANGIDRSEAAIFAGLQVAGLRLTVLHDPAAAPAALELLQQAGVTCRPLTVKHRLDSAAITELRVLLHSEPFDVVYAPINRTLSAALQATRGMRLPVVGYRGTLGHLSRWDPACWLTYFHPRLSHVVCVSDAVMRHLTHDLHFRPERLTRIYKGHDPAWYVGGVVAPPLPPSHEGMLTIGFAGRVRPVKGVRHLLDALRWIPPDEPVRIVLIGSVDEPAVQRQLLDPAIAGRVVALGYRQDAAALIGRCDVFAMPSVAREGLPRAVIEAMSQGVPLVATSVGGLPEAVADGETGLVVPPRDPRALAAAFRRLRNDPALRVRLGDAGRRRVDTVFHVRHSVAAYEVLFRRLCHR